jgi:hypothetical protein
MKLSFKNLLMEYQVQPYKRIVDGSETVTIRFDSGGLRYEASLFHDDRKHDIGEYELEFNAAGQRHAGERTKKDITHLFNVIYTVIDAMETIVKERKIKKVKFEGAGDEEDTNQFWEPTLRAKLYQRIVDRRYPEDAVTHAARFTKVDMTKVFPELFANEEQTNVSKLVDLLVNISSASDPDETRNGIMRGVSGTHENDDFSISTDWIDSESFGTIYVEIGVNKAMRYYSIEMDFHQDDKHVSNEFRNFDDLYDFLHRFQD